MTLQYQAPRARTAWLGHCLLSPLRVPLPPPPLCYILLFFSPSLSVSLILFTSLFSFGLCFTLLFSSSICLPLPSLFSFHSLHHQSCFTAPSPPSPLTVNNFALVLFSFQSFFFSKNISQGPAVPVMETWGGGSVVDKRYWVFIEVSFCRMQVHTLGYCLNVHI